MRNRVTGNFPQAFLLLAFALCSAGACAQAQTSSAWPARPIRLIVPYAPGGAVDGVGRIMAQSLAPRLGQQLVVDNRAGGGGVVGMDIAAQAQSQIN